MFLEKDLRNCTPFYEFSRTVLQAVIKLNYLGRVSLGDMRLVQSFHRAVQLKISK